MACLIRSSFGECGSRDENCFEFQNNIRIDIVLAQCTRYRDAMMPIANKVILTQLNELNKRQGISTSAGDGDAQPAMPRSRMRWVEITIEIIRPAFSALDPVDWHGSGSSVVLAVDPSPGNFCGQIKQTSGTSGKERRYLPQECSGLHQPVQVLQISQSPRRARGVKIDSGHVLVFPFEDLATERQSPPGTR